MILNGCQLAEFELKIPQGQARRLGNVHSYLLIGTSSSESTNRPRWNLGSVTLYKKEMLTQELAVLLSALGPDGGAFLTSCQDGQPRPNFPLILRAKLLGKVDWGKMFGHEKMMEALQANLLLAYSAHKADSVFMYPSIISPTAGKLVSLINHEFLKINPEKQLNVGLNQNLKRERGVGRHALVAFSKTTKVCRST